MAPETSYFTHTQNLKRLQQDVQIGQDHTTGTHMCSLHFAPPSFLGMKYFITGKFKGTLKVKSLLQNEEDDVF